MRILLAMLLACGLVRPAAAQFGSQDPAGTAQPQQTPPKVVEWGRTIRLLDLCWAVALLSCGDGGPTTPSGTQPLGPGSYFLFKRSVPDTQQLIIMRSDGTGRRALATGSRDFIELAALAPDHSRIAFVEDRRVFLLSLPDEHVDTVLDEKAPGLLWHVGGLAWSPDSRRLAISARRLAPYGLLILNAEGQVLDSAKSNPGELPYWPFAWSPDGQRVAYTSLDAIWTSRLDGSDARQITRREGYSSDYWPRYSPDGTKIAFLRERASCTPPEVVEQLCEDGVMVIDTGGVELRTLAVHWSGEGAFRAPVWAPDRSRVAFVFTSGPTREIRVIGMGGSVASRILLRDSPWFLDWR